ncbi:MAG: porin family protein [Oceanihabitans sp.]
MKKLVLAIVFLAIGTSTFAQVKIRPGFRVGLNSATYTNTENTSRKLGVNAALFANVHFARFYELQPEITYSNQGFKQDDFTIAGSTIKGDEFSVNYLGLAITNKFFIVPNTGIHVLLGPTVEINIGDDSNDDDITPIDFSLFGGIGYEFPFGLGLEARY